MNKKRSNNDILISEHINKLSISEVIALKDILVEYQNAWLKVSIKTLNEEDSFCDFIKGSFPWVRTTKGQFYWSEISKK